MKRLDSDGDDGAALVLTLVLCLILGPMVIAISSYATAGLRSSTITDTRNERLAAAEAGVRYAAERIVREEICATIVAPAELTLNDLPVFVSCSPENSLYRLVGVSVIENSSTAIDALIQVIPGTGQYSVLSWQIGT